MLNRLEMLRLFVAAAEANSFKEAAPVSYTHLTLPTILRV